jgi:hypothetical protein
MGGRIIGTQGAVNGRHERRETDMNNEMISTNSDTDLEKNVVEPSTMSRRSVSRARMLSAAAVMAIIGSGLVALAPSATATTAPSVTYYPAAVWCLKISGTRAPDPVPGVPELLQGLVTDSDVSPATSVEMDYSLPGSVFDYAGTSYLWWTGSVQYETTTGGWVNYTTVSASAGIFSRSGSTLTNIYWNNNLPQTTYGVSLPVGRIYRLVGRTFWLYNKSWHYSDTVFDGSCS